MSTKESIIT